MKKIMDWLGESFAPTMNKFVKKPWIAAVAATMQKVIPFILTGSVISFYGVIRSYISSLPDLSVISTYTFNLLGILIAFIMTNQAMDKLRHSRYTITASLTSISAYFIFINAKIEDGVFSVPFERFGPTGIFLGLVVGIFVAIIFNLYAKIPFLRDSSIPDFVVEWIHNVIPISVTIGISSLLTFGFHFDLFDLVTVMFSPLQSFGQSLPGFVLICFIPAFFYSLGISAWVFNSVTTPIFMAGIYANIEAVSNGLNSSNISTSETVYTAALVTMGGVGCTLALNILMMFSKSRNLKTLGRVFLIPSFFNINEPLMFGAPVVMNPLLMVPVWISSIVGSIILWCSMNFGLLNIPSKMLQVGQIPAPFSSMMITGDWRAVIVYVVLLLVYLVIWYPFFKVYEKECIIEEGKLNNE